MDREACSSLMFESGKPSVQLSKARLINLSEEELIKKPRCNNSQQLTTCQALTLHIEWLHLNIIDYIKENMLGDISVKINWKFLKYKQSSDQRISNSSSVFFGSSNKYLLQMAKAFFEMIKTEPLTFELYVYNKSEELLLSKAKLYFGSHFASLDVRFVGVNGDNQGVQVGKLSVRYEFNDNEVDAETKPTSVQSNDLVSSPKVRHTQSEMSNDLRTMINRENQKMAWKQTLQKNRREQVEEEKETVKPKPIRPVSRFNTLSYRNEKHLPKLTINIKKLCLFPDTRLIKDDTIKKIYVEYEFLNYSGFEMETPYSKAKPKENQWLDIDFVKAFPIHLESNQEACKAIVAMIKNYQPIKFSIVSEPDEDPRVNIQTCKEVAVSHLYLSNLVEIERDEYEYGYNVLDSANLDKIVGELVVSVDGIAALKKLALTLWHL